jgi:hypothetical protein
MARIEHESGAERKGRQTSILTRDFVRGILRGAQQNLVHDGGLAPVLFLHMDNGESGMFALDLPPTHDEKAKYFAGLRFVIEHAGRRIDEALFVSESWYVSKKEGRELSTEIRPSEHPNRKEAIVLVGRDAEGTRQTLLVQTFTRDIQNRPVFGEVAVEEYHGPESRTDTRASGLLDYLFPPDRGGINGAKR